MIDAIQVDMRKRWSVILSLATPPERWIKIVESESIPAQGWGKGFLIAPAGLPGDHPLTLAFSNGDIDHELLGAFVNSLRDQGWAVEVELIVQSTASPSRGVLTTPAGAFSRLSF